MRLHSRDWKTGTQNKQPRIPVPPTETCLLSSKYLVIFRTVFLVCVFVVAPVIISPVKNPRDIFQQISQPVVIISQPIPIVAEPNKTLDKLLKPPHRPTEPAIKLQIAPSTINLSVLGLPIAKESNTLGWFIPTIPDGFPVFLDANKTHYWGDDVKKIGNSLSKELGWGVSVSVTVYNPLGIREFQLYKPTDTTPQWGQAVEFGIRFVF